MSKEATFESASLFLKQALPLMSKHRIPVVPSNYAVWYEYVAGRHTEYKTAIDRLIASGAPLEEETLRNLYEHYFENQDQEHMEAAQLTLKKLIEAVTSSIETAGSEVTRYEESLHACASQLSDDIPVSDLRNLVSGLLESTQTMTDGNQTLQQHLEESKKEADTLRQELERVRTEAKTDPLTGLANRKGFDDWLTKLRGSEGYREQRHCLLIGDIDKFKSINDSYGHVFGDKIIKVVAKAFANLTKGKDIAARFGGEEFVVAMPETTIEGATALAESIRSSIERGRVYNPKTGEEIRRVTISIGVTELNHDESLDDTVARADAALYRAKENGRNRVEIAPATATEALAETA